MSFSWHTKGTAQDSKSRVGLNKKNESARTRMEVCKALQHIIEDCRTIDWIRAEKSPWIATPLHRELIYGTTRHYLPLQQSVTELLKKPMRDKDRDLFNLLIVGAYQLKYTGIASYAVINESVNACIVLGKPWAKGLVNAVLRQLQRAAEAAQQDQPQDEYSALASATADHPPWLKEKLEAQYPAKWQALVVANSQRAPMTLRINTTKVEPGLYKAKLREDGIAFIETSMIETVILKTPQNAETLPSWSDGEAAVQDLSAQLAANTLMSLLPPHIARPSILDACAAPGGKLFHLHERLSARFKSHQLFALDNKKKRLNETKIIGTRLGHSDDVRLTMLCADATEEDCCGDLDFDSILLDAPCSGSGTIRRNPDIRLLMKSDQLTTHQDLQLQLLRNLWRRLKEGGTLLYSTCSIFEEENDQVIEKFINTQADAESVALDMKYGNATSLGWQLLPSEKNTDGFYYSGVSKVKEI
jgi:16S rRNA (cytosine967-C5)-methyltransferase